MTYTRTWDQVLNVPGTRDADEIDNAFRETHTDLTERFAALVQDVNADPWVPFSGALGFHRIHAWGGNATGFAVYDPTLGAVTPDAAGHTGLWLASLPMLRGLHLKSATFYIYGPNITASVKRVNSATAEAPSIVASASSAIILTGPAGIVLSGLNEVISTTNDLYLEVSIPGDGVDKTHTRLYAVDLEIAQT